MLKGINSRTLRLTFLFYILFFELNLFIESDYLNQNKKTDSLLTKLQ